MNEIDVYSQPSYDDKINLYHSTSETMESRLLKFKYRRKPRDTNIIIHKLVNGIAIEKFGLPIRNLFFVYVGTRDIQGTRMRAIPLGDKVRYFFNPEVEDFTLSYFNDLFKIRLPQYIMNIYDGDDVVKITKLAKRIIYESDTVEQLIYKMTKIFDGLVDNSKTFTKNIVNFIKEYLTSYVDNIVEVDDVSKIPENTDAEVMIYAPDDIYLISPYAINHKDI